jgi:hypothetical protein
MTATSKTCPLGSRGAVTRGKPTRCFSGKAEVLWEETGKCTTGTAGAGVQAPGERLAEITSGRTIFQQGLVATCKDPPEEAKARAGGRDLVWRMSPYERRRGGNSLRGGTRCRPWRGNSSKGQRGSGHLAVPGSARTQRRENAMPSKPGRAYGQTDDRRGVYVPALKPRGRVGRPIEESQGQNRIRENRPSGIVGGPRETRPWWNCEPTP